MSVMELVRPLHEADADADADGVRQGQHAADGSSRVSVVELFRPLHDADADGVLQGPARRPQCLSWWARSIWSKLSQ